MLPKKRSKRALHCMRWNSYSKSVIFLLFIVFACGTPPADDQRAEKIAKEALSIPESVTIEKLRKGPGGAQVFLVSHGNQKHVIRFMKKSSEKEWKRKIHNLEIADRGGYGPKVYFTKASEGIEIMEYFPQRLSFQDLQLDRTYIGIGNLLRKIHRGEPFDCPKKNNSDPCLFIEHILQKKSALSDYIPLTKMKEIVTILHTTLLPYRTLAPCHQDLHLENIMFSKDECKAIDYDNAGFGDPYFDLATVCSATNFCSSPHQQELLFSTYLERAPSEKEKAILYLMKCVVVMKNICRCLRSLHLEEVRQFTINPNQENLKISCHEREFMDIKIMLAQLFADYISPEFQNAVHLLQQPQVNGKNG